MLHPAAKQLSVSPIQGLGLWASAPIRAGEVVWWLDPDEPVYTLTEIEGWPADAQAEFAQFAFQSGEGVFSYCRDVDRYTNHSCDPNTWWSNDDGLAMVACRDIAAGEEITYDYATSDILVDYRMDCRCGAANCRRVVTNRDYLDPAWQRRYGAHLPRHVLEAVRAACASAD